VKVTWVDFVSLAEHRLGRGFLHLPSRQTLSMERRSAEGKEIDGSYLATDNTKY
jgi:hypothetical protein